MPALHAAAAAGACHQGVNGESVLCAGLITKTETALCRVSSDRDVTFPFLPLAVATATTCKSGASTVHCLMLNKPCSERAFNFLQKGRLA